MKLTKEELDVLRKLNPPDDPRMFRRFLDTIDALESEAELKSWKERAEQAETQLAGCGVAALGWNREPAKQGDWGWSASYQDVLTLRQKYEALQAEIAELKAQVNRLIEGDRS